MFSEMLTHSEEKIFLEAIDQYFEKEHFEDTNLNNTLDNNNKSNKDKVESNADIQKETDIELMNIKFYEALNIDSSNGIKDISTDIESEDSLNTEKVFIKIRDCLILSKEAIEKSNKKVFESYKNQIIFWEKNKELFKNNKNRDDIKY
jgi:hypothetical protein